MKLLVLFLVILPSSLGVYVELQVLPVNFPRTKVGSDKVNITVSFTVVDEYNNTATLETSQQQDIIVNIEPDYTNIITLNNYSLQVPAQELQQAEETGEPINKSISVDSWLLGYYSLTFTDGRTDAVLLSDYRIIYTREFAKLDTLFTVIMTVAVTIIVTNMGCQLDFDVIKASILRPIGPAVGFSCQFLFMPLVSFGISKLLFDNPLYQLGLFVLGTCPGGTMSNFWTLILGGDVNLSITMTFVSIIAAMGMMPLWLWTLGPYITEEAAGIKIPYMNLMLSLVALTIPLGLGFLIKVKKPKVAEYITKKVMKPLTILILLIVIPFGIYNMKHMVYLMTWQMFVAGSIVAYGGYAFGAIVATLFRLGRKQIIAISLETAFQNGTVCFVLLKLSLQEPERDLAALPAFGQFTAIGPPLWLILAAITIYSKFFAKKSKKDEKSSIKEDNLPNDVKEVNVIPNNKIMMGETNKAFE